MNKKHTAIKSEEMKVCRWRADTVNWNIKEKNEGTIEKNIKQMGVKWNTVDVKKKERAKVKKNPERLGKWPLGNKVKYRMEGRQEVFGDFGGRRLKKRKE